MRTHLVLAVGALAGLSTAACIVPSGPPPGSFTQTEEEAASGINDTERGAEVVLLPEGRSPGVDQLQGRLLHRDEGADVDHWLVNVPGQHLQVTCESGTDAHVRVEVYAALPEAIVTTLSCAQPGTTDVVSSETGRFYLRVFADDGGSGTDDYVLGVGEATS